MKNMVLFAVCKSDEMTMTSVLTSLTSQTDTEGHTFTMIATYLGLRFLSHVNLEALSCGILIQTLILRV